MPERQLRVDNCPLASAFWQAAIGVIETARGIAIRLADRHAFLYGFFPGASTGRTESFASNDHGSAAVGVGQLNFAGSPALGLAICHRRARGSAFAFPADGRAEYALYTIGRDCSPRRRQTERGRLLCGCRLRARGRATRRRAIGNPA